MGRAVADSSAPLERFLTHVSLYWFTDTGGSCARQYDGERPCGGGALTWHGTCRRQGDPDVCAGTGPRGRA
ncbi:hypothetical protein GCM10027168_11570 [Streptomyces capparidis]